MADGRCSFASALAVSADSVASRARGDALDLVAVFEGLDTRTRFQEVLARAAQIAGVAPSIDPAELARIRAEHEAVREARDREVRDGAPMLTSIAGGAP